MSRTRRIFSAVVVLTAACLFLTGSAAHAVQWSAPVRLSPPGKSWFPAVATDAGGGVHAFWSFRLLDPGGGRDTVRYCRPTSGGCDRVLEVAIRKAPDGDYVTRPAAAVDREGTIHLLWRRKGIICYQSASILGPVSLPHWSPPRKMADSGSYATIVADERDVLHAAWSQAVWRNGPAREDTSACAGCADIFYSRSEDRGRSWSTPVNVSDTEAGSEKPHIALARDGTIYLAWEEGHDFYVGKGQPVASMLAVSRDGGRTWAGRTTFAPAGDTPQSVALGVDGSGRVVVVWQQVAGDGIFFQSSSDHGESWSPPEPLPGVRTRSKQTYNDLDGYDMAVDAAGHLHLVVTGRSAAAGAESPEHRVYHFEWDGASWCAPMPVFTTRGVPEWPRIAVGNGNQLHVVWFERPEGFLWETEGDNYAVWYAQATSDAPAIAPIVWPDPGPERITAAQLLYFLQFPLAVAIVAAVVVICRRHGW